MYLYITQEGCIGQTVSEPLAGDFRRIEEKSLTVLKFEVNLKDIENGNFWKILPDKTLEKIPVVDLISYLIPQYHKVPDLTRHDHRLMRKL